MAGEVAHMTYAPPTQEQAFHAATHVGKMLLGVEPKVPAGLIWHLYTVVGYGVNLGFPVPIVFAAVGDVEEAAKALFGPLAGMTTAPAGFDWKQALIVAIRFLLKLLG